MAQQTNYELTKTDTKMMQGVAIFAMVMLHLFDTYDYGSKFIPSVFLFGYPLVFYFAQLSDFCVMAFAFCSGYAHMAQYGQPNYYKRRLIGLFGVYINFWIVLILFSVISIIAGNGSTMPGNLSTFIGNFTSIHLSYNGAWWYILTYALISISSPVLLKMSGFTGKRKVLFVLLFFSCLYCAAYYERFTLCSSNWFLHQFGLYGMTATEYIMGSFAYEHKAFSRIISCWNNLIKNPIINKVMSLLLFFLLLLSRTLILPQLFFAPLSGFLLLLLFQKTKKPVWFKNCLLMLGIHSTNIWLTHMFFYLYIFIDFVYVAKYPILIMMLMMAITIFVSIIINAIHNPIFFAIKSKLYSNYPS